MADLLSKSAARLYAWCEAQRQGAVAAGVTPAQMIASVQQRHDRALAQWIEEVRHRRRGLWSVTDRRDLMREEGHNNIRQSARDIWTAHTTVKQCRALLKFLKAYYLDELEAVA